MVLFKNCKLEVDSPDGVLYSGTGITRVFVKMTFLLGMQISVTTYPEGEHQFEFLVDIPPHAASSFEGGYGKVVYTAKVTLKIPGVFADQTYKGTLKVLQTCDLNLHPNFKDKLEVDRTLHIHSPALGTTLGSFHMRANIYQSGFVPGETVPVNITISNKSSCGYEAVEFFLTQLVTYKATTVDYGGEGQKKKSRRRQRSGRIFKKLLCLELA